MPIDSLNAHLSGRTIHCILFDIGNTLWTQIQGPTITRLEIQASQQALTILSEYLSDPTLSIPPANDAGASTTSSSGCQSGSTLGERLRLAINAQLQNHKKLYPLREPNIGTITATALFDLGITPVKNLALGATIAEALRLRNIQTRHLFSDVPITLAELHRRGFTLGIVTNRHYGGLPFYEDLRDFGLLNYFDYQHMAISADLGLRKPNPAIFLHALNSLTIPPQEAAMVGDSLRADVYGAHQLGMLSIWKPRLTLRYQATQESPDKADLFEYIQHHEQQWHHHSNNYVRPDLTIKHISDLLEVFHKAGPQ